MKLNMDLKDKKLLYELDLNSRQSFNELGKKVGLSKNSVKYRIDNLQRAGIIKKFHTAIDIGKLGYIGFRLYLKLQNTNPEKEKEILDFLIQKDIIVWVVSIEGDYNIGALILTQSIKEMNELWKQLLEKYINFIDKRLLTIMTNVSYFSRAYLLDLKTNIYKISFLSEPEQKGLKLLDKTDINILKLLSPNARMSIVDISTKLGLTTKTIINRINNLEKKKIITGYKTVFDLEKLGYQYYKLHFKLHNVSIELEKKFKGYIVSHPNIVYDDEVLGGDDLEIEIQVKNALELRKILEEIRQKFGEIIRDYKTMLYYKEHKYLFLPVKFE